MFEPFFSKYGTAVSYATGDVITDCELNPKYVYRIVSGYVKASLLTARGNEHLLIFYKPGDIFPARWAFTEIKGHLFYSAVTPVVVRKVAKNEFTEYLLSHPEELLNAVKYTTTIMDVFVNRTNDLEHLTAYLRLLGVLISLAERYGKPEGEGTLIEFPVTQADLARSASMTRETLSREMSKLERNNLVTYQSQHIYIPELQALKKELNTFSGN